MLRIIWCWPPTVSPTFSLCLPRWNWFRVTWPSQTGPKSSVRADSALHHKFLITSSALRVICNSVSSGTGSLFWICFEVYHIAACIVSVTRTLHPVALIGTCYACHRFHQCAISPVSLEAIKDAGYERMTQLQEATLPVILQGHHTCQTTTAKSLTPISWDL